MTATRRISLTLSCMLAVASISSVRAAADAAHDPLQPAGKWAERSFGDAALPPMGWNSWNAFHTQVDEAKLRGSAQAIVDSGLRDLGYRYVNIDDGWWQMRAPGDGRMVVRTSIFPSARGPVAEQTSFRPLVDWLHALGLKAGIYSDIGRNACSQGYPEPDSLLPTGSGGRARGGSLRSRRAGSGIVFSRVELRLHQGGRLRARRLQSRQRGGQVGAVPRLSAPGRLRFGQPDAGGRGSARCTARCATS